MYVPGIKKNLIYVSTITENALKVEFLKGDEGVLGGIKATCRGSALCIEENE